MLARSWLGVQARWTGPQGSASAITDLAAQVVPVLVIGHDACDGGGLRGVLAQGSAGPGEQFQLVLRSGRGFTVWGVRFFTNAGSALVMGLGEPPSTGGAPGTVGTFGMLREVSPTASMEPTAAAPFFLPITTEAIDWHGRPIVVQPNETLWFRSTGNAGAVQLVVMLEEGL
jgi:hypothetical protein